MTVVSHAALGAVIAMTLKEPALVLPLALASHYVLDALPHFGYPGGGGYSEVFKHRLTYLYGLFDFIASAIFLKLIWGTGWLVYISAFVAVTPDIANVYRYLFLERKRLSEPGEGMTLSRFHRWLQWGHYPWGILVEIAIAVLLISLVRELQ